MKRAPWIAIGAAGAWFFDTTNGEERRRRLRARLEDLVASRQGTPPAPTTVDLDPPQSQVA